MKKIQQKMRSVTITEYKPNDDTHGMCVVTEGLQELNHVLVQVGVFHNSTVPRLQFALQEES